MTVFDANKMALSGAEWDVLWCLFRNGATWDGNIPSKVGRNSLINKDLAYRDQGWTILTIHGFHAAIAAGMDKKKGM
jgi:hypothetical protein